MISNYQFQDKKNLKLLQKEVHFRKKGFEEIRFICIFILTDHPDLFSEEQCKILIKITIQFFVKFQSISLQPKS